MDFVVNWIGDKAWTLNLDWEGKEGFASEGDHKWINKDGETAGFARTYDKFTFLQVANAGHMVPLDQPANALEMLDIFLTNSEFY